MHRGEGLLIVHVWDDSRFLMDTRIFAYLLCCQLTELLHTLYNNLLSELCSVPPQSSQSLRTVCEASISFDDDFTISQDNKLSQCTISCASETSQVLSPVLYGNSYISPFNLQNFLMYLSLLFFTCIAVYCTQ